MTPEQIRTALQGFRDRIDQIDNELLVLLNERAKIAMEIGKYKRLNGLPIEENKTSL